MSKRALFALAFAAGLKPAWAQAPAETGTGSGPSSTIRAPNTTAVGQTKPPGSAAAPAESGDRQRRERIEEKSKGIESGICIGCDK